MESHSQQTTEIPAPGELARQLIRFDTTSPGGSERELIAWLAPQLEAGGLDVRVLARDGFLPMLLPPELRFQSLLHAADERVPVAALDFGTAILADLLSAYRG